MTNLDDYTVAGGVKISVLDSYEEDGEKLESHVAFVLTTEVDEPDCLALLDAADVERVVASLQVALTELLKV